MNSQFFNKKFFSNFCLFLAAASLQLVAFAAGGGDEQARIINIAPVYAEATMQKVCDQTYQPQSAQQQPGGRSATGSIIGGIAGALAMHNVGGGNGRIAATAAGAILGAVTGDRLDNQAPQQLAMQQPVQQCRMVQVGSQRLVGHLVTYEFRGQTFQDVIPVDSRQMEGGTPRLGVSFSQK
jgi:uncharacterized protein YcfJ